MISFGDSDHDIIKYTRYSKNPPVPARILYKRSYKDFNEDAFIVDATAAPIASVAPLSSWVGYELGLILVCFLRKQRRFEASLVESWFF